MKYTPNLHLYKLNQGGTRKYIKRTLKKKNIGFTEYNGNIYSIRFPERPLFVAHMDTVRDSDMSKPLEQKNGILQRRGAAILGADDKAGIDIIMQHLDDINFCFTRDEEIGGLGAQDLLTDPVFAGHLEVLPCAIEYDRMNNADMIRYCSDDLANAISEVTHYKPAEGTYTDVLEWSHIIPCVNLSVGYFGQHTNKEILHIDTWRLAAATLPILNMNLQQAFEVYEDKVDPYYNYASMYKSTYDDDYDYIYPRGDNELNFEGSKNVVECHHCGITDTYSVEMYEVPDGQILCEDCLDYTYGVRKVK